MKTMGTLRSVPRSAWMLFGAAALSALAALALTFGGSDQAGTALAHRFPADCDTTIGSASASIAAPGTVPPVVEGQTINYRVGAAYPNDPSGVACQAFDIQVWLLLPGDNAASEWQLVCTIAELDEGESAVCPATVPYVASGADRNGELLQAFVEALGHKHDQTDECITSDRNPNGGRTPNPCFGGQATSNILMPHTPTPTPTNTPTHTPTNTPTHTPTSTVVTNTPTPTATNTPEERSTRTPVRPPRFTPTSPPDTPTPIDTALPATVAPTNTPVGVTLPPAGGGGPLSDLTWPVALLASLAIVFASAGIVTAKRRA